jgi:dihydrodipicolinate synthase
MQLEALPLIQALFCEVNPIPVKMALNLMGYNLGSPRLPLIDLTSSKIDLLKSEMTKYGIL